MGYIWDRYERNEMYAAERDEHRSARRELTEMQLATACGHSTRSPGGFCYDCKEGPE